MKNLNFCTILLFFLILNSCDSEKNKPKQTEYKDYITFTTDCIETDSFIAKADIIVCRIPHSDLGTVYDISTIEPEINTRSINTIRIDLTNFICGVTDECINRCSEPLGSPVYAYCDPDPKIRVALQNGGEIIMSGKSVEISGENDILVTIFGCAKQEDPSGCIH